MLRRELNGLVAAWHHRTGQAHGITHAALRKECGGPAAAVATAEQLHARIDRSASGRPARPPDSLDSAGVPAETSQTLDRGLRVLDVLAASPDGLTVTELAARLEVNRTIVLPAGQHARAARARTPGRRAAACGVGLGVLRLGSAVQPVLRDARRTRAARARRGGRLHRAPHRRRR